MFSGLFGLSSTPCCSLVDSTADNRHLVLLETFPTQRNLRQKIPSADCKAEESLLACIVLSPMMKEEPDPPRIPRPSSWNSVSSKAIGRNPAVSEWTQVTIHGAVMEVGGAQTA